MERGSAKHGSRLDDEMGHETQGVVRGTGPTHAEEWKEPEPMEGDARGSADHAPGREPGVSGGMTQREVEWRSELARVLAAADYPTTRGRLLDYLGEINAPGDIVRAVLELPDDQEFRNVGDITRALGIHTEQWRA